MLGTSLFICEFSKMGGLVDCSNFLILCSSQVDGDALFLFALLFLLLRVRLVLTCLLCLVLPGVMPPCITSFQT